MRSGIITPTGHWLDDLDPAASCSPGEGAQRPAGGLAEKGDPANGLAELARFPCGCYVAMHPCVGHGVVYHGDPRYLRAQLELALDITAGGEPPPSGR